MTQRARRQFVCFYSACLIALGCTKLEDPNQWFGNASPGGKGSGGGSDAAARDESGAAGTAGERSNQATGDDAAGSGPAAGGRDGSAGASCEDGQGFHGLGCYRCPPTDIFTLENACSSAACTPFEDAKRLTLLDQDGNVPPLPAASGGAGGTAGSSTTTAGSGAGGATSGAGGGGATGMNGTAGGGAAGTSGAAATGKACAELAAHGTVVYITGSSAAKPFLQQIAQQLVAQNVFIVYESTGSCVGVDAVLNGTLMKTGPTAAALSATYWDSAISNGLACDLPVEGVSADIGASDVFAQSCAGFEAATLDGVRDAHGPIQTMAFAVPFNSAYTAISAKAAYFVFGFGALGGVISANGEPIWNDENYLFKRSASSGTQVMLAQAIGVPAADWKGKAHKTSDDVAADLQAAGQKQDTANAALGIIAADYIDTKNLRAQLRVLAFQDSAQHCAVYPDSTSDARDKRNVRDGHYPVWGPLHLLLRVDSQGKPINPASRQAVTDIVGYLSGTKALPNGVQLINVYAQSGLVPECAMRVTRSKDGGNIYPFQPASPCACLFDKLTGSTNCTECAVQGDCAPGQSCSLGYCEAQ